MRAVNLIRNERPAVGMGGRSQGAAAVVLALIGVLAILAGLYGIAHHEVASRRLEAAQLEAQAQSVQQGASKLSSYTSFSRLRDERVQDVSELIETRFDWANALRELGRVLPSGASIAALNGSIAGGATTGLSTSTAPSGSPTTSGSAAAGVSSATPAGSVPTFSISGCATSQSEVARTIDRLGLIAGVSDVLLLSSSRGGEAGSSSSSSSLCPPRSASFSLTVTFDALPASVPGPSSESGGPALTARRAAGSP